MTAYPAVHDMPAARTETTLTPDQVKQATEDLMSERDRTEAQAQAAVQPVSASNAPATTGSIPQKKSTAATQPAGPAICLRRQRLRQAVIEVGLIPSTFGA